MSATLPESSARRCSSPTKKTSGAAGLGDTVGYSRGDVARLACYAACSARRSRVRVRGTRGVEAHTHEFMARAHDDQRFGFSLASGAADEAVRRVLALPSL